MKKTRIESNFMRNGVAVLYVIAIALIMFYCWYWGSYIFRVSDAAFKQSLPGSIPSWLTVAAIAVGSACGWIATIFHLRDNKKNKFVPYDGKFDKDVFFTR